MGNVLVYLRQRLENEQWFGGWLRCIMEGERRVGKSAFGIPAKDGIIDVLGLLACLRVTSDFLVREALLFQ